ncbi:hypothetical protein GCM10022232_57760 [Streptomyces plumbiresistens]|uniref:Uncharacterized protein n=1 Tax=Streptomyces plumbiresistens TaxID=511811 RepID=A0ABP7SB82_9ACTN
MLMDGRLTLRGRARAGTAHSSAPAVRVALAAIARIPDTIRRFAADCPGMASSAERAVMVGAAELARFAAAPRCGTRHEGVL